MLWRETPRRDDNAVTRRMERMMFPSQDEARRVVDCVRRQQGLHQLHKDFCRTDVGCSRCVVYLARKAGELCPL
jgi:hypothetical protein